MSGQLTFRYVGESGLLVELASNEDVHRLAHFVRTTIADRVLEVIPGHDTVLIVGKDRRVREEAIVDWQQHVRDLPSSSTTRRIAVRYDGDDLRLVAEACRLSPEEVARRHQGATYVVAFSGFAPGFAYLTGLDPQLRVPRRVAPRPAVPAGSVAVAGEYCAIYPNASPGGWNLLGRTQQTMFDAHADPPAYLQPGDVVKFQEA